MSEPADRIVVDARGLRCPLPVIRLAQRAREAGAGAVIEVWATDPAAAADIPAWCRMRGHELVDVHDVHDVHDDERYTVYSVQVAGSGSTG